MSDKLEQVARAICGSSAQGGYCDMIGGEVDGCKVGRGESYNGANCKARLTALMIGMEGRQARAAITAYEAPSITEPAMVDLCDRYAAAMSEAMQ